MLIIIIMMIILIKEKQNKIMKEITKNKRKIIINKNKYINK